MSIKDTSIFTYLDEKEMSFFDVSKKFKDVVFRYVDVPSPKYNWCTKCWFFKNFLFFRSNDISNSSNIQSMKERIKAAKNVAIISVSSTKNLIMSFSEKEQINWIISMPQSKNKREITVSKGKNKNKFI